MEWCEGKWLCEECLNSIKSRLSLRRSVRTGDRGRSFVWLDKAPSLPWKWRLLQWGSGTGFAFWKGCFGDFLNLVPYIKCLIELKNMFLLDMLEYYPVLLLFFSVIVVISLLFYGQKYHYLITTRVATTKKKKNAWYVWCTGISSCKISSQWNRTSFKSGVPQVASLFHGCYLQKPNVWFACNAGAIKSSDVWKVSIVTAMVCTFLASPQAQQQTQAIIQWTLCCHVHQRIKTQAQLYRLWHDY